MLISQNPQLTNLSFRFLDDSPVTLLDKNKLCLTFPELCEILDEFISLETTNI